MGITTTLLLAAGLAMDAASVALCARAGGRSRGHRAAFRLSFHFGLFQGLMPIIGWLLGSAFVGLIAAVDHWVAFGLLAIIGLHMIRSGLRPGDETAARDLSRGWTLILLSVATSIDALAVGLSLAVLGTAIWIPALVIALVTTVLSLGGYWLGRRLDAAYGHRMTVVGGIVLILVGLRILLEHLLA